MGKERTPQSKKKEGGIRFSEGIQLGINDDRFWSKPGPGTGEKRRKETGKKTCR